MTSNSGTRYSVNFISFITCLAIIIGVSSCQDPIIVGSDLYDDERIALGRLDTLKLSSYTIKTDKVFSYVPGFNSRTFLIGQLDDPVFGKLDASIYMTPFLPTAKPNFEDGILDSMELILQLDTLGTFGPNISAHKFELYQLAEKYNVKDTASTNFTLPLGNLIGSVSTNVRPKDSISLIDHITRKSSRFVSHVRIPISKVWAEELMFNKEANSVDTIFAKVVKGFYLKSTPISGSSIVGFNLLDAALSAENRVNKLNVFFHRIVKTTAGVDTMIRLVYPYQIAGNTVNNYTHTITGSVSQTLLDDKSKGNEYTLLQGAAGLKTVLTFDNLMPLKNIQVTKVEIDIFVGSLPGQNTGIAAPFQLFASRYDSLGKLVFIEDINQLNNQQVSWINTFGGGLNKSSSTYKYTINVTNHVKKILANPSMRQEIVLGILTEAENANQAVLYGAKHPIYPMKVRVSYAK